LLFWSKYKDFFLKNNINVVISPYNSVKKCIDKYKFYKFCNQNDIPTINTINDLKHITKLKSNNYVLKDRFGSGSKKIEKKVRLNYIIDLVKKIKNSNYIIQDFCDSKKEYSVDAWYSGDLRLSSFVVRERKYVDDGESKITINDKKFKLNKQLESYLKKFRFYGPINFQFFLKNSSIIFIECNPRFGGASTFSIKSGLDLFYYSILNSYYKDSEYDKILYKKIYPIKKQIRLTIDTDENYYL
jgi:carbamoyl-phosphate synthase large subunit